MSAKPKPKKGPQKHQNSTPYKFDKYRTDPKAKVLANLRVINCCKKCTDTIEWKIKYGKYKILSQPSKCVQCAEKRVKYAYHTRCEKCVELDGRCAKCGEKEELIANPGPTKEEQSRLDAEFQNELKQLPERRRRTFLRYIEKQEKDATSNKVSKEDEEVIERLSLEEVREKARTKLKNLKEKYAKNGDDFDFEDEDSDGSFGESDEE